MTPIALASRKSLKLTNRRRCKGTAAVACCLMLVAADNTHLRRRRASHQGKRDQASALATKGA